MRISRLLKSTLTAAVATAGLVVFDASPTLAIQDATVHALQCGFEYCPSAGYGWFHADPAGSLPGDALKACDLHADRLGIKAWLYNRDTGKVIRTASTAGHASPYCTGWKTGDLPEQTRVWVEVCKVSGSAKVACAYGSEGWS
ncbi:hypothetical protein ABT300_40025 [Streptomyces sp. NPDC001027]|uniref:hypothetical protein n=1 Tax=Streptomyces sp. NPDC001027 TaxID=3154771 RepID=UPI0033199E27